MISAKNIYNSYAYKQLKAYANGDKQKLKLLVEQYVQNFNASRAGAWKFHNCYSIPDSFIWVNTPQGHNYWLNIHNKTDGKV